MTYLDMREINGYSIHYTDFYPFLSSSSSSFSPALARVIPHTLLYIGLPSNPSFLGPQSPHHVADVIRRSEGISGTNAEYLFRLEESLAELGPGAVDLHVSGLVERVKGRGFGGEGEGEGDGEGGGEGDGEGEGKGKEFGREKTGEGDGEGEGTQRIEEWRKRLHRSPRSFTKEVVKRANNNNININI